MRLVAGRNENNRWDWKRNLNKAWLNLGAGMGMGMDNWKQQGVWLKKTFPLLLW